MKKNLIALSLLSGCAILLASCGTSSSQSPMDSLSTFSESNIINQACGANGVQSFILQNSDGTVLNNTLNPNEQRGLSAKIICSVTNQELNVTNLATWSSSNNNIVTVTNTVANNTNRGYIAAVSPGTAAVNVTFGIYQASTNFTVNAPNASLTGLNISTSRIGNTLAKGETVDLIIAGNYSDGSSVALPSATITDLESGIIAIQGNKITALESGDFTIMASYQNQMAILTGTVTEAQIVGFKIDDSNLQSFSIALPRTVNVKGQFILSDGTTVDVPKSTLNNQNAASCSLYHQQGDTSIPFVNAGQDGCQITSTSSIGENRLTYKFSYLNADGTVDTTKPTYESNIIIAVADNNIKGVHIEPSQDMSSLIIGKPYRYRVYADMVDGSSTEITKVIPLQVSCSYNSIDCSNDILSAKTGYIGTSTNAQDDGLGGFIQIVNSFDPSNQSVINNSTITLKANLGNYQSQVVINPQIFPNVWNIGQLSSYFVNNVYGVMSDAEKKSFTTFTTVDSNGIPIANQYYKTFLPIPAAKLSASPLTNSTTIATTLPTDSSVTLQDNINLPRANEYATADNSYDLSTTLCNNSNYQQNMTSANQSRSYATSYTLARGFSVGLDVEFNLIFNKDTVKTSYTQQWTWSNTATTTYTLPSQTIAVPAHGKAIVLQKMYPTKLGGTKQFNVPLNSNSCLPYKVTGNNSLLSISSNACTRLADLSADTTSKLGDFGQLLSDGNTSLAFQASYITNTVSPDAISNSASVYIFVPGDPGYDAISCGGGLSTQAAQANTSGQTATRVGLNLMTQNGNQIPLNPKNLVSMKFAN